MVVLVLRKEFLTTLTMNMAASFSLAPIWRR